MNRVCWLIFLGCLMGCHPVSSDTDASAPPESCFVPQTGHPIIRLSFLGAVPQQLQNLRFRVDWEDNQADLKGGSYQFFVDGQERTLLLLPDRLISASNAGSFELLLPLPTSFPILGRRVNVELVLRDKRGTPSNRPKLLLELQP